MKNFEPKFATSGIGSLPFNDASKAIDYVLETCPEIPYWPQLPKITPDESMIRQFTEGLPGIVENDAVFVDTENPVLGSLVEEFYEMIVSQNFSGFGIAEERSAGLYALTEQGKLDCMAMKGQITGPVSFGLSLTDKNGKYLIYNDLFRDVYVKLLAAKANFVQQKLSPVSENVIIFADEPLLYTFGSAFFNMDRETLVQMIKDVFAYFDGITGIHACHNCDWSIIFDASPGIISFDAYSYLDKFLIYTDRLTDFINGGGVIAWGIVPTTDELYLSESPGSLSEIIEKAFERLNISGVDVAKLARNSIITPADGVGTLSEDHAKQVFELNANVSEKLKDIFVD